MVMPDGGEKREGNRLLRSDPAVMVLADGQQLSGHIGNMNMRGVLFVADVNPSASQEGLPVEIRIRFNGMESRFACVVVHHQENRFGLKLCQGSMAEHLTGA